MKTKAAVAFAPRQARHEGAGVIEQAGAGVSSVRPGDHVPPPPAPQCGRCEECLSSRSNLCVELFAGFNGDSPFSSDGRPVIRSVIRFPESGGLARGASANLLAPSLVEPA